MDKVDTKYIQFVQRLHGVRKQAILKKFKDFDTARLNSSRGMCSRHCKQSVLE